MSFWDHELRFHTCHISSSMIHPGWPAWPASHRGVEDLGTSSSDGSHRWPCDALQAQHRLQQNDTPKTRDQKERLMSSDAWKNPCSMSLDMGKSPWNMFDFMQDSPPNFYISDRVSPHAKQPLAIASLEKAANWEGDRTLLMYSCLVTFAFRLGNYLHCILISIPRHL